MDGKNDGARLLIPVLGLPSCFGVVREVNLGSVRDANLSLRVTEATQTDGSPSGGAEAAARL